MLKRINSRGDTIVEVLIALAVLSLAFGISYATANRSLEVSQNAQEHSLALEYLNAQIEGLRYVANQPGQTIVPASYFTVPRQSFCLVPSGNSLQSEPPSSPGCCQIMAGLSFQSNCNDAGISITSEGNDTFQAEIKWPGLGNLGEQSEMLAYRVYPI